MTTLPGRQVSSRRRFTLIWYKFDCLLPFASYRFLYDRTPRSQRHLIDLCTELILKPVLLAIELCDGQAVNFTLFA